MNLFGASIQNVRKQHFNLSDFPNGFFDSLIQKAKSLLTANRVLLFGSFARGDALEKSDIDIAHLIIRKAGQLGALSDIEMLMRKMKRTWNSQGIL